MSERGVPLPGAARSEAGLPPSPSIIVEDQFAGINQQVPRSAVPDKQMWWCVNFMPIAPRDLRTLYDIGGAVYTRPGSATISHFGWYILQDGVSYGLVFLSDGSAQKFQSGGSVSQVAPAGTFEPTGNTLPAFCQYGAQYVAIVTDQTNGFFLYDNTNFYQAGTISPEFTLTDGGLGYTSAPSVAVHTNGSGTGAAFTAQISGGAVSFLTCAAAGSGFAENDLVWLTFSGGGSGTSPQAHANLINGVITSVVLTNGDTGGNTPPTVTISDPTGTGAQIVVNGFESGTNGTTTWGFVTSLQVVAGGSNYSNPTISFSGGGGGATALISNGVVGSVTIDNAGSGLSGNMTATMLDPNGSGAELSVVVYNGSVTEVIVQQGGSGYIANPIGFSGGGVAAATVSLMPFGVNGTSVETYQSRLWITGGVKAGKPATVFFSVAETATNFGPPGGAFPSTDSFLKHQWTFVKQDSGFLYLGGDSSVNYISGVQTSGTPANTTFSNLNIDPTIGTVWPNSVAVFGTTPMFANVYGVHAIIGGSVRKVSDALDLLFFNAPPQGETVQSSALATIFGKHIYCFLMRATSPVTGVNNNYVFCWDGQRWWAYHPSVELLEIATLELNSNISAWGTDGNSVYELFVVPSTGIQKGLYSKFHSTPNIIYQKKAWAFYALWDIWSATSDDIVLSVTVDTENGSTALPNNTLTGAGPGPAHIWSRSGGAQGAGYVMGFSLTSTGDDFSLHELDLAYQTYALRT